ncbi:hypothetical protein [Pyxidicoccus xibeiensis]|uniref:hypothetical protein n=1 Tax=Pyxidicoccus xibeiensis TaxID=2906759 RepID=UPI0020A80B03|nr:hypothetical protein [Pyxidicoccus xibeiensis]MCP3145184.1 hypothetical protein [Pyxidicoccus xibeiensis]
MTEQVLQLIEEALRLAAEGRPLVTAGHLSTVLLLGDGEGPPQVPYRLVMNVPEHDDTAPAAAFELSLFNVPGEGGAPMRLLGLDVDPATKKCDVTLVWPEDAPLVRGTLSLGHLAFP